MKRSREQPDPVIPDPPAGGPGRSRIFGHPVVRRLMSTLVVITVFLGCLFVGHALGQTALGGVAGLFAAALLGDRLTGCGICSLKRIDRH